MQYYLFKSGKVLLNEDNTIPEDCVVRAQTFSFCLDDGVECMAANVEEVPSGLHGIDLRQSYDLLPLCDYLRAGKAFEIIYWQENHRFCGRCGAMLEVESYINKRCPACGKEFWPQLSPAVIVLIYRGEEILLVQSNTFRGDYYGLVAGFVEFGESLEECVRREVREETQIEVSDVRYFGSQPWPYPQGLMLGFMAAYKSGELCLQQSELKEGGWFSIHNLPNLPKPLSMARRLIDNYISTLNDTMLQ